MRMLSQKEVRRNLSQKASWDRSARLPIDYSNQASKAVKHGAKRLRLTPMAREETPRVEETTPRE